MKLGSFAEDAFGIHGILEGGCFQNPDYIEVMAWACDNLKQFCRGLTDFFIGSNAVDNLASNFDTLINQLPSGASVYAFLHYAQLIDGDFWGNPVFRKWDHGIIWNLYNYGQTSPPEWKFEDWYTPHTLIEEKADDLGT